MVPAEPRAWILGAAASGFKPVAEAPTISAAATEALCPIRVTDESGLQRSLYVPFERALGIRVDATPLVTLMTLAGAPQFLVLGYLRNQGLIHEARQVRSLEIDAAEARVVLREPMDLLPGANGSIRSGCGLGRALLDPKPLAGQSIARAVILSILDQARRSDAIHRAAGSVHSAILFDGTELLVAVEDVSRHNGVDTLAGWMLLHDVNGVDKTVFTTGRLTAEMVLKAAHCGIATLISRNGTTATACQLAQHLNLTLIGRAANKRFICFTGAERIL